MRDSAYVMCIDFIYTSGMQRYRIELMAWQPPISDLANSRRNGAVGLSTMSQGFRVQTKLKSVEFHDAENRQLPYRMVIRHVKDAKSAC
ncbi:hypothetical protein TNCV_2537561 [Trichonephila clavipes]|nr:hypothetical protein TNCV_2537561 [Trichonephila clavipes]